MTLYDLIARLDAPGCLGFRAWEFSLRSLRRRYGLTFLTRVVLRHPVSTVAGMLRHRRVLRETCERDGITLLCEGPEEEFVVRLAETKTDLLVATGFCQKPLVPECPAGRPNHDCAFLDELDLDREGQPVHPACDVCHIRTIGTLALRAGACMHIMTSALDIARDVMIPSLDHKRFSKVIMGLCPYSVRAITLPLTICGLEGYLFGYESGNCATWDQWLQADQGIKNERTALGSAASAKLLSLLEASAEQRARESLRCVRFERQANIYVPVVQR